MYVHVCVCMCVCVCVCVRACVRVCMLACVGTRSSGPFACFHKLTARGVMRG